MVSDDREKDGFLDKLGDKGREVASGSTDDDRHLSGEGAQGVIDEGPRVRTEDELPDRHKG